MPKDDQLDDIIEFFWGIWYEFLAKGDPPLYPDCFGPPLSDMEKIKLRIMVRMVKDGGSEIKKSVRRRLEEDCLQEIDWGSGLTSGACFGERILEMLNE